MGASGPGRVAVAPPRQAATDRTGRFPVHPLLPLVVPGGSWPAFILRTLIVRDCIYGGSTNTVWTRDGARRWKTRSRD